MEKRPLRSKVSGFRKTEYTKLCIEIFNKISQPRQNIFEYVKPELFKDLSAKLAKIQEKNLSKKQAFRTPYYQTQ